MEKKDIAIRKRSQIAVANRTMFIWIATASALVGIAIVVGTFLFHQLVYNEKVLGIKQTTNANLKINIEAIEQLKQEVVILETNTNLAKVKANESDKALQVILDALPDKPNTLALGASLQNKLLVGIPGLDPIESLVVQPVSSPEDLGAENANNTVTNTSTDTTSMKNTIEFSFKITGTQEALKQMLNNFERSIRTIRIGSIRLEAQKNNRFSADVTAYAFYEPSRTLELRKEVVPR